MYSRVLISSIEVKSFSKKKFSFTFLFRSNIFTSLRSFDLNNFLVCNLQIKNKEKYFLLRNALVDHIYITKIILLNNMIFFLKFNINYVISI